jgi:hypothetical protein
LLAAVDLWFCSLVAGALHDYHESVEVHYPQSPESIMCVWWLVLIYSLSAHTQNPVSFSFLRTTFLIMEFGKLLNLIFLQSMSARWKFIYVSEEWIKSCSLEKNDVHDFLPQEKCLQNQGSMFTETW